MIARRLRPIGWVAGVAGAALCLYLVSLQVAGERAALASVERKIATTERQIRQLETEFSARASLRQLQAYNDDVLALAAPKVDQYLTSEVQLASYAPADGGDIGKPVTALASAQPANRPTLRPAVVTDARTANAPVIPAARRSAMIQTVAMFDAPPEIAKPVAVAKPKAVKRTPVVQRVALLDGDALGEIGRKAAKEARGQ